MSPSIDPNPKNYDPREVVKAFITYANLLAAERAANVAREAERKARSEYYSACKSLVKASKLEDSDNYNAMLIRNPFESDEVIVLTIDPVDPGADEPRPEPHARMKWITPLS